MSTDEKVIAVYRCHLVWMRDRTQREKELNPQLAEKPMNCTAWEVLVADSVEHAIEQIHRNYRRQGKPIKRIFSLNHIGDVTVEEDYGFIPQP